MTIPCVIPYLSQECGLDMPHTEQQRLLSCGSTDQRRKRGGGVVTEISEAHRPSVLFVGGGVLPYSKTNETPCTDLLLGYRPPPTKRP